jgi:hypothetical protein
MNTPWSRIIGTLCLGVALWVASVAPLSANTATNLTILYIYEDSFYNYDFLNQNNTNADNVDWALSMLFYDNATVTKVKGIYWGSTSWGSAMHGRINDGGGWLWSSDKGTKEGPLCASSVRHMRLYANGNNRSYNSNWGYYVLGSTHYDLDECIPWNSRFGWSETAEAWLAQIARDKGYTVFQNWNNWHNAEPERWEADGKHFWQNNGMATAVRVP